MLEPPDVADASIVARLQADYGLSIAQLTFLPLGFDVNCAVFRAVAVAGTVYFVKLRRAGFDPVSVTLPRFLSDQGVREIIAPLHARDGRLWSGVGDFRLIVYPFVEGRTAREIRLSERQWLDFGAAVKRLHTAALPPAIMQNLPRLTYSSRWRDAVKMFVSKVSGESFVEPVAVRAAALLDARRAEICDLVDRADRLAATLPQRAPLCVVCHTDIHASNLLIGSDDRLYIVDWDNPAFAPKERDLMFAGGGQGFIGYTAREEEMLFYRGYGDAPVDRDALMYYRCERIIEDIALACEALLSAAGSGADRELTLHYLESNFAAGGTVEAARRPVAR